MNERVQELKSQCYYEVTLGTNAFNSHVVTRFDTDKFAELIIRECVNKIVIEQDNAEQNWSCKNGVHIAWEMLDYFGVDK